MDIVNMETSVTLDITNKFAKTTTVIFFLVKRDIQGIADGSRSLEDANLHPIVNTNMQKITTLKN